MPLPLGPIAAKVGIEAGKRVAAGIESRGRRADAKTEAELQRIRSFQEDRHALVLALAQATDPDHRTALQAELKQLQIAETQKVKAAERGKTTRRAVGAAAVVGVLVGGAFFAHKNIKDFRDAVVPEVTVTTEQKLNSALTKVEQRSDKIIATGSGVGEATVSTRVNVGMFGVDLRLPGGLVGSEAKVTIPRNLDVVSKAGAVRLEPMQDPADGSWDVLALVNPAKIAPQVSGNRPPTSDSGANTGFFNDIGHALGLNEGEQAQLYKNAETIAVNSFEASASRIMTQPRTLAALQANSIRQSIQEVSGATPPGDVHDTLARLATADIHVAFVSVDQSGDQATFINPSDATALQAHMTLPKPPTPSTIKVSSVEISMTTPEQLLMSQETRDNLNAIENQPGYTLVTSPSVIEPYVATQAPN